MTTTAINAPGVAQDELQLTKNGTPLSPRLPPENSHPEAGIGRSLNEINEELREKRAEAKEKRRQQELRTILAPVFIPPSKRASPTFYDNETMPALVYGYLSRTDVIFTQKLAAAHLGVDVSTLKRWKGEHQDMKAAIAQGLAVQEAYLATLMAGGMKYSASIYAVLKNIHDWSDKVDQRVTLDLTEAIRKQATGAKRVQWDKALPAPGQPQQKAHVQAEAQSAGAPLPPFTGPTGPAAPDPAPATTHTSTPAKGEHAPHA
jgi:hypothetical protein